MRAYTVASLDGPRRHFDRHGSAVAFAHSQAQASWSTPEWSVRHNDPDDRTSRTLVARDGSIRKIGRA